MDDCLFKQQRANSFKGQKAINGPLHQISTWLGGWRDSFSGAEGKQWESPNSTWTIKAFQRAGGQPKESVNKMTIPRLVGFGAESTKWFGGEGICICSVDVKAIDLLWKKKPVFSLLVMNEVVNGWKMLSFRWKMQGVWKADSVSPP